LSNKPEAEVKIALKLEILDYDKLKEDLVNNNEGNDISAKFATRTRPEEAYLSFHDFQLKHT